MPDGFSYHTGAGLYNALLESYAFIPMAFETYKIYNTKNKQHRK